MPEKKRTKSLLKFHAKEQTLRDLQGVFSVPKPMRNIAPASDFLDDIIKEIGAKEGVEHQQLLDSWREIAGDYIAEHVEPASLKHGVLVLRLLQPSMRFHLEQLKPKLLKNLQAELGKKIIRQVRFSIG